MTTARSILATPPDLLDRALGGCGTARDPDIAAIFARVGALLDDRRTAEALAMLEYAQRRAPSDGGISLAIGVLRLNLGEPRASEPLEMLAARNDWRDIRMTLVRVRMRFGHVERAALDLHAALSRNGTPCKPSDLALATAVARAVGAQGWCALSNAGRVTVGALGAPPRGLTIRLDGTDQPIGAARPTPGAADGTRDFALPAGWQRARRLEVLVRGRKLIGSAIDIARVARVEGFVEGIPASGALRGWCWFPAERERAPEISIAALGDPKRRVAVLARFADEALVRGDEFGIPHSFTLSAEAVEKLGDAITVSGPHGQPLYGSPLWPRAARDNAQAAIAAVARLFPATRDRPTGSGHPASASAARLREVAVPVAVMPPRKAHAPPRGNPGRRHPVDVIIPVYTGREMTLACIEAVRAQLGPGERIVVVSDASPDADLVAELKALAKRGHIVLQAETVNRGFPGTANIGLRLAAGRDAVLLNSDTVVTPGWLAGLRAAVYAASDIGTATPLSNDATIFSYPRRDAANPFPTPAAAGELAALAASAAGGGASIEVPTGHGFCIYMRAECIAETGLLREDLFAQGYGEENDFCMRARHLGWRHVAVPGVFVAHRGSQSFSAAREDLMRRNLETLNRLHVGYEAMIAAWQRADPLRDSRRRIDLARLRKASTGRQSVLMVTHDRSGGVRQYVAARAAAAVRAGLQPLVLRPVNEKDANGQIASHAVSLDTGFDDAYPNLHFRLPEERDALAECLRACAVAAIEVNSLVGHAECLVDLLLAHTAPLDLVIHDYSWFCPRITLTTGGNRYCGEPPIAACRDCVSAHGTNFDEDITPDDLLARSQRLIAAARAVIAPSEDAARRIRDRFAAAVTVRAWEAPRAHRLRPPAQEAGRSRPVRVAVVGAIGHEKGYMTLLSCARIAAAARLPLEFVVVGHTRDDKRLLETGVVRLTGRYEEAESVALIAAQNADFAWLPSVWPETWSYVLTRIWEAGLFTIVHDIGAPAERVRAFGGGLVLPLHVPPERLVAVLLDPGLFRPQSGAERGTERGGRAA
jgi:GT2 family glycosyltransferase/glycosyltransferase involved in cell wall biosynthesis